MHFNSTADSAAPPQFSAFPAEPTPCYSRDFAAITHTIAALALHIAPLCVQQKTLADPE
jgi:hypothetical protein